MYRSDTIANHNYRMFCFCTIFNLFVRKNVIISKFTFNRSISAMFQCPLFNNFLYYVVLILWNKMFTSKARSETLCLLPVISSHVLQLMAFLSAVPLHTIKPMRSS